MQSIDLKHLKNIIALCRKSGVSHIKIDTLELTLEDLPEPTRASSKAKALNKLASTSPANSPFETDSIDPEDLLFWSAVNPSEKAEAEQEGGR